MMKTPSGETRIAILGAGVAGAAAARTARDRGATVTVFDKGRRPGGRCSTRRSGSAAFDHGAPCFTAEDPGFAERVTAWHAAGVVAPWKGRFGVWRSGELASAQPRERWVGVPGMDAIVQHLLGDLDCRSDREVTAMTRDDDGWRLAVGEPRDHDPFDEVVIAMPPEQAARFVVEAVPSAAEVLGNASMRSCWTAMIAFDRRLDLPFDALSMVDHPSLAWAGRDSSKPGRGSEHPDGWVVHGRDEWSSRRLNANRDEVARELGDAFEELARARDAAWPGVVQLRGHRWKFGRCDRALGTPHWRDAEAGITLCGDWLLGPGVEHAFLSGTSAGKAATSRTA